MESTLSRLKNVSVGEFRGSRYVVPQTVSFDLKGSSRTWDMIKSMGSVAIVLYHKDLDAAVLVRQFRPPVWAHAASLEGESGINDEDEEQDLAAGFNYELCAGLIDKKDLSAKEIAKEEILEECGYDVELEAIEKVTTYVHAAAHLGSREQIFYAQVDESMRKNEGGGLSEDGESIEVFALPLDECERFIMDPTYPKSAAAIIGLQWLLKKQKV